MPGTFDVDHTDMPVGIYSPGSDRINGCDLVTVDVRCVIPYEEKILTNKELHTVEHILAVEIAKECDKENSQVRKIYWGPMGCQTGFYLLAATCHRNQAVGICSMLKKACENVLQAETYKTPANTKKECGHYNTLYGTAKEVKWIIQRIAESCEAVIYNEEFCAYTEID